MTIRTLSEAANIVEFLISKQKISVEEAIKTAEIPLHLREQLIKYFKPPLEITPADLIVDNTQKITRCDPEKDSPQQYFGAFREFLINTEDWTKPKIDSLTETSLSLIRRLPKPDSADKFQIRGLVLGYIQSGKTANMAALIARAADEGYKLFIVLGGLWKDLRAQTQRRLDKEIAGQSDDPLDFPCVKYDENLPKWVRLTGSGTGRDFTSGPNDLNPQTLKLAVIKKNSRIEALAKWLKKSPVPIDNLPAVIIDDEADHGSIDTNYGKMDDDGERISPTATNKRIRDLLQLFPKCIYIGFTATPFANVLIDAGAEEDLYPRDFIVSLPEPPGYFGPRKLFGLGMEPSDLSPSVKEKPELNIIRIVDDHDLDEIDEVFKSKLASSRVLSDALLTFVLSCCARLARRQDKDHFSMLVHPSQKTEPHRKFADVIRGELLYLKKAAALPDKFPDAIKRAKEMWESDFLKVTHAQKDSNLTEYKFETIWKFAKQLIDSIEVKILNSHSDDRLDYDTTPRRYIVVGGNKLSRGLTLEGLSVSVFTRNANQYDTLLQMGRWFGFRPDYYDLTRIFVSQLMAEHFAELARVEDEFRADCKKYSQEPDPPTPLQLKPIIRSHPAMAITSRMKMGAGKPIYISFQNILSETVTFPVDNKSLLEKNIKSAHSLISGLSKIRQKSPEDGNYIWSDISSETIIEFLNDYEFSREARDVNRQNLVNYIKRQNQNNELISWDVVLPHGSKKMPSYTWAKGVITHKIFRRPFTAHSIKVLSDPNDIETWKIISGHDRENPKFGCMMLYLIDKTVHSKRFKFFPDPVKSEDILGLVFVFPKSKSNATVEYVSQ